MLKKRFYNFMDLLRVLEKCVYATFIDVYTSFEPYYQLLGLQVYTAPCITHAELNRPVC